MESSLAGHEGPIDTFVVPGTYTWAQAMDDPTLTATVSAGASRSRRVAAVCGGAFLLGAVGLLDGRSATTHWICLDDLEKLFPAAKVQRGPSFTQDGPIYTPAVVTAGIDLALALVESDLGPRVAREVAQILVVSCNARAARNSSARGCAPNPSFVPPCGNCSTASSTTRRPTTPSPR